MKDEVVGGGCYPAATSPGNWRRIPCPVQSIPGTYTNNGAEFEGTCEGGRDDFNGFNRVTWTMLDGTSGKGQDGSDVTVSVNVVISFSASVSTSSTVSTCAAYDRACQTILGNGLLHKTIT